MTKIRIPRNRDTLLVAVFSLLSFLVFLIPTGFESNVDKDAVRCKGRILEVDNSQVQNLGMVKSGDQGVTLEIMNGPFKGRVFQASNPLLGQMDRDKIFKPGDTALVVLTLDQQGEVIFVNPQEHYRLGLEMILLSMFAVLLIAFGGWTGVKALLSFLFAALMLWKVLVPLLLKGTDPILTSLGIVALLSAAIIFLVAGVNRRGVVAFCGAFLGVLTSCIMAAVFTKSFHVHGAVMPFAETLLYSGFQHLNLTEIYVAAEVLKTLVGSFGLVTVAPFTALIGSLLLTSPGEPLACERTARTPPERSLEDAGIPS